MTMKVYMKYGSDTVDFQASGCIVLDGYYPQTPGAAAERATEKFDCWFIGTAANAKALINKANQWFQIARNLGQDSSPLTPIWMYFAVDENETAYRARVYDGDVLLRDNLDHTWRQGRVGFSVVIERDPFWEGEEAQISLTNPNGTDNTSGLNVYNCNDLTGSSPNNRANYVEVTAVKVTGDLPAPAKFKLAYGSRSITHLYIGHNVFSDPSGLDHWHEGETGLSDVDDAACSNAKYHDYAIVSGINDVTVSIVNEAQRLLGNYYRVMARMYWSGTLKVAPYYQEGVGDFAVGGYRTITPASSVFWLYDLGLVRMPLQMIDAAYNDIKFGMRFSSAGSITVHLDYMQLTPVDSWQYIYNLSLNTGYIAVIDNIENKIYALNASSKVVAYGASQGGVAMVYPNKLQRYYFLSKESETTGSYVSAYFAAKLYYRPRKKAL